MSCITRRIKAFKNSRAQRVRATPSTQAAAHAHARIYTVIVVAFGRKKIELLHGFEQACV